VGTVNVVALVLGILTDDGLNAYSRLPQGALRPIMTVEEAGGPQQVSHSPNRLTRQDLQLDVWGTTKTDAFDLVVGARDLLLAAPRTQPVRDQGVLVRVSAGQPTWLADPDWPDDAGRPGPRYLLIVQATAHE